MQATLDDMRDPKRPRVLSDDEEDCMREIRCFVRGGELTQSMLPKIIHGMWAHWNVRDDVAKQRILQQAGAYDARMDIVNLV
jgi:hypothetical protein